jgi:membrane-bound lytic murein transglycosylase B
MIKGREIAAAAFTVLAVLACLGAKAYAAQCGSTAAGFEAWKGQFAEEARAKGVGASSVAAMMQTPTAAKEASVCRSISFSRNAGLRPSSSAVGA